MTLSLYENYDHLTDFVKCGSLNVQIFKVQVLPNRPRNGIYM